MINSIGLFPCFLFPNEAINLWSKQALWPRLLLIAFARAMPIAATQESSSAINVISFSLVLLKWDIFLKDLTSRAMWLEAILIFSS